MYDSFSDDDLSDVFPSKYVFYDSSRSSLLDDDNKYDYKRSSWRWHGPIAIVLFFFIVLFRIYFLICDFAISIIFFLVNRVLHSFRVRVKLKSSITLGPSSFFKWDVSSPRSVRLSSCTFTSSSRFVHRFIRTSSENLGFIARNIKFFHQSKNFAFSSTVSSSLSLFDFLFNFNFHYKILNDLSLVSFIIHYNVLTLNDIFHTWITLSSTILKFVRNYVTTSSYSRQS